MVLNPEQQKLLNHLEQIEEVGELILAKQQQSVQCDKNRQLTREALRAVTDTASESKQWVMLSNQFFRFPNEKLKCVLREDIKVYDAELEKIRRELKEDINLLRELEGVEGLKGFNLLPLTKADTTSLQ